MDSTSGHLKDALTRASASVLAPASLVLGVAYLILAIGHLLALPTEVRAPLASLAFASAATPLTLYFVHRLSADLAARADFVVAGYALLVWANSVLHMYLLPELRHTTNFSVMIFGLGLVVTQRPWFYALLLLTLGSWVALVATRVPGPADHWAWMLLFISAIAIVAHEQRRRSVAADVQRERMLVEHATVLQELMSDPTLAGPDTGPVFERLVEVARTHLAADRAGIWLLDRDAQAIDAAAISDVRGEAAEQFARHLDRDRAPAYFAALERERSLAADDARRDPRTRELTESYLEPLGIRAMLDSPMIVDARLAGVICVEAREDLRRWSLEELSFAASLASFAALSLQAQARARLEDRTRTTERLESMGLLAGGVAHDFNNLLTAVIGNTELALMASERGEAVEEELDGVLRSAQQAADLAGQMLAYAGRGTDLRRTIVLGRVIEEYVANRTRSPGAPEVHVDLTPDLPTTRGDAVQIAQILLNVVGNAADAGARNVCLRTGRRMLDEQALQACSVSDSARPGPFVFLEAEDDGAGMDATTAARIFDPFFSTKRLGQGLGLAASLGTVRAHGGAIDLDSGPGRGTRFRFYFPASETDTGAADAPGRASRIDEDARTLVVEDEALVRDTVTTFLERAGHAALPCASRADFDRVSATLEPARLRLAVLDLTLPDGDGVDIALRLRERAPALPILLVSGYDARQTLDRIGDRERVEFLGKPFTHRAFMDAVARITGEAGRA
jgi:signal transduction histidine kinase/CheY-like chemotaxis protein